MRGFRKFLLQEIRLYLREPAAFFFGLIFPTLLIVIFGYTFGKRVVVERPDGLAFRILDLMVAGNLSWVLASMGLLGVYPVLTSLREAKVLKFYQTHPIRVFHVLLAQYASGLLTTLLSFLLMLLAAKLLFRVRFGGNYLVTGLLVLVSYSAFFAMGFAFAAVTPTTRLAQSLGNVLFFPMFALSGIFGPRTDFPPFLKLLSDLSPLSHAYDLLTTAWVSPPGWEIFRLPLYTFQKGTPFLGKTLFQGLQVWHSLLYLLVLAAAFSALAIRTFRWGTEERGAKPASFHPLSPCAEKPVIQVRGLRKNYGQVRAVDGLTFEVFHGEIFGIIGPNGAGKTTTVEILEGLRSADEGEICVLGMHPLENREHLIYRIGVQLQEATLPPRVKVREILETLGAYYPRPLSPEMLMRTLGLWEKRDRFFGQLSGGEKQRLFAALALLPDPDLIFLDEITTGLDPKARRDIWAFIRALRDRGKTIVLTTHYMEEAEALCDRVAVLNQGRLVALDTPQNLIQSLGIERCLCIELEREPVLSFPARSIPGVTRIRQEGGMLRIYGQGDRFILEVLAFLNRKGIRFRSLRVEEPDLEDVFLALTGSSFSSPAAGE